METEKTARFGAIKLCSEGDGGENGSSREGVGMEFEMFAVVRSPPADSV